MVVWFCLTVPGGSLEDRYLRHREISVNKITRAVRIIIAAAVGFILSLFAATILAAQTLNSPQSNATPQNIGNQSPSLPKVKPKKVAPLPKLMQPVKVTPQNIGNQTPSLPQVEPVQHSNIPDPDPEPSPEPGAPETNVTSLPTPSGSNVPASNLGNIPGVTPDLKAEQMQNRLDRNQIERIDHASIEAMREAADALEAAGLREGGFDPGTGLGNRDDDGFLDRLGELGDRKVDHDRNPHHS